LTLRDNQTKTLLSATLLSANIKPSRPRIIILFVALASPRLSRYTGVSDHPEMTPSGAVW